MKIRINAILPGFVAGLVLATGANATVLVPNSGVLALDSNVALPAGGAFVVGYAPQALVTTTTLPGLTGTIYEGIYREAGGTLDFVYQFVITDGSGVTQATLQGFNWDNGVTSDVAYYLTGAVPAGFAAPTGTNPIPPKTDRSGSNIIHFDWDSPVLFGPGTTAVVVIATQATTFTTANIHMQDDGQISATGWAPAPEPRLVGLLLSGLFGFGLFLARRRQMLQS